MNVGLLNLATTDISVTVSLARDGCALLNCTNSNGCSAGVCQCKRFTFTTSTTPSTTYAYGFAGPECRDLVCPGQPACSARGYCVVAPPPTVRPMCQCANNYNGTMCEVTRGADMSLDFSTTNLAPINQPNKLVVVNTMYSTNRTGRVVVGKATRTNMDVGASFTALFVVNQPMALVARLESRTATADPILMARANQAPSLTEYDELDLLSWTSKATVHTIATAQVPAGQYYISVLNTRYGEDPLSFVLYYEFASLCPPSLTFAPNASNATAGTPRASIALPRSSSAACSGNGDPYSFCSNPNPAIPPPSPSLCTCLPGYEGLYCDTVAPTIMSDTTMSVASLQPGQWQYFVFQGAGCAECNGSG